MAVQSDITRPRNLNQEIVRDLLDYDPETGILTWRKRDREWFPSDRSWKVWNICHAGQPTGSYDGHGYLRVRIFGRRYLAHRLIVLWMTGDWSPDQVDHINHVRDDNRWCNLRLATSRENSKNRSVSRRNTSGTIGVFWATKDRKWRASIFAGGKRHSLGGFADKAEAIDARKEAEHKYGFHHNHGAG